MSDCPLSLVYAQSQQTSRHNPTVFVTHSMLMPHAETQCLHNSCTAQGLLLDALRSLHRCTRVSCSSEAGSPTLDFILFPVLEVRVDINSHLFESLQSSRVHLQIQTLLNQRCDCTALDVFSEFSPILDFCLLYHLFATLATLYIFHLDWLWGHDSDAYLQSKGQIVCLSVSTPQNSVDSVENGQRKMCTIQRTIPSQI